MFNTQLHTRTDKEPTKVKAFSSDGKCGSVHPKDVFFSLRFLGPMEVWDQHLTGSQVEIWTKSPFSGPFYGLFGLKSLSRYLGNQLIEFDDLFFLWGVFDLEESI